VSLQAVLATLASVYDPELDEPVTELGFVAACSVSATGHVDLRLRLPTPQCAPNFAFLMAADARRAVLAAPGVRGVTVRLEDHYTRGEIDAAVERGEGFGSAFPGETEAGDLEALRELFQRKALVARQARICAELMAGGATAADIASLRLADVPPTPDARRCVALREALGLPHDRSDAALVAGDGSPLAAEDLPRWLRRARLVSLSLEANGGLCRDLLAARYGSTGCREATA
jgi:metal-sulfur cluster biosynthetic enzyme